jgi:23S rRNA (pseudouridine1915-N3)-methyltransferase
MKIILLLTGKTTEKYIADGINLFTSRVKKYTGFEIITLPELKNAGNLPVNEQKNKEGTKILSALNKDDFVIVLDEKGKAFRTIEFSEQLKKIFMLPRKRIIFVIGGPWGFSQEVFDRSDLRLSLSSMTFSHQMVRLLFLEQLYRVLTVIKGDPYHHE